MADPFAPPCVSRKGWPRRCVPHLALASAQPQVARAYAQLHVVLSLRRLTLPRPDVIIATSPQLLAGLAGWWIAFSRQIPFVFEVRDLWPESLAAVGVSSEDSLLHRTLAGIARFLYERSDRIVVVTPAFKDRLIEDWRVPAEKISIVENGVETEVFAPLAPAQLSTFGSN